MNRARNQKITNRAMSVKESLATAGDGWRRLATEGEIRWQ